MLHDETTLSMLRFRRERDWEQFHSPLNLAIAISVESSELLEQFQWSLPGEIRPTADQREAIEHEVADITMLLTYLVHDLDIDLDSAVRAKLALNAVHYPVEKAKGNARKHNRLT